MSEILRVENLVQHFVLDKAFLDKVKVKNGKVTYETRIVNAVNGVSFFIEKGEAFGLVGESGCGKSTTARTIIGLNKPTSGEIFFDGKSIAQMSKKERMGLHKQMQMIFQDPYASLNPRMRVIDVIREPLLFHSIAGSKDEADKKAIALLERVGIRREQVSRFPHQFSGGQRQRIGIARALAVNPGLIVADEPVSALDVSIQAQILNLLMDLKEERNLSYLFIAHDLSVVEHLCTRLGVMYLGKIVEMGTREQIFGNPKHPYTQLLLNAAPKIRGDNLSKYEAAASEVPTNVLELPKGCAFCSRCPHAVKECFEKQPELRNIGQEHLTACHRDI